MTITRDVTDRAGNNVALGKPVASLDSIESGERWSRANLTDGLAPSGLTAAEKAELETRREALLLAAAEDGVRVRRDELRGDARRLAAEVAALPKPNLVYAGGIHRGTGSFTGTGANFQLPGAAFFFAAILAAAATLPNGTMRSFDPLPNNRTTRWSRLRR